MIFNPEAIHLHPEDEFPVKEIKTPRLPNSVRGKLSDSLRPADTVELKRFSGKDSIRKHVSRNF